MKSIYFARHSFTEYSYQKKDFDRTLTKEGFSKIKQQAILLKKQSSQIDLIISSSAKRALQTAQEFKKLLNIESDIISYKWLYEGYTTQNILELFQNISNENSSVMLIAHNPSISIMANNFNHSKNYIFNPASIVNFNFEITQWKKLNIRIGQEAFFLE